LTEQDAAAADEQFYRAKAALENLADWANTADAVVSHG